MENGIVKLYTNEYNTKMLLKLTTIYIIIESAYN